MARVYKQNFTGRVTLQPGDNLMSGYTVPDMPTVDVLAIVKWHTSTYPYV